MAENLALRRVMKRLNVSQEELARRIREDGRDTAGCNRAMVDRWLRGITRRPQPRYLRALERVTGMPAGSLGFAGADDDGFSADGVTADAAAMEGFRKADLRAGGSHMYGTVREYLRTEVAPRLVMPGGREIFTAAGALTEMGGWMSHDAGRDQAAREHFARALDLARTGGDRQLIAHILASAGHIADHLGDPDAAVRSAQAGLGVLLPGNPSLRSYLFAVQARGFAGLHDADEAVRCLCLAETALQDAQDEPRSQWINRFDEASLANEAARCMRHLGDLGEARRQAETVIALRPATRPRSRAFGLFTQASVLAASGKPDEAATVACEILTETDGLGSYLVVRHLTELQELLLPYQANAVVTGFLERLRLAMRRQYWLPDRDIT